MCSVRRACALCACFLHSPFDILRPPLTATCAAANEGGDLVYSYILEGGALMRLLKTLQANDYLDKLHVEIEALLSQIVTLIEPAHIKSLDEVTEAVQNFPAISADGCCEAVLVGSNFDNIEWGTLERFLCVVYSSEAFKREASKTSVSLQLSINPTNLLDSIQIRHTEFFRLYLRRNAGAVEMTGLVLSCSRLINAADWLERVVRDHLRETLSPGDCLQILADVAANQLHPKILKLITKVVEDDLDSASAARDSIQCAPTLARLEQVILTWCQAPEGRQNVLVAFDLAGKVIFAALPFLRGSVSTLAMASQLIENSDVELDQLVGDFSCALASFTQRVKAIRDSIVSKDEEKYVSDYDKLVNALVRDLSAELDSLQTGRITCGRARMYASQYREAAFAVFRALNPSFEPSSFQQLDVLLQEVQQLRDLIATYKSVCSCIPKKQKAVLSQLDAFEKLLARWDAHDLSSIPTDDCFGPANRHRPELERLRQVRIHTTKHHSLQTARKLIQKRTCVFSLQIQNSNMLYHKMKEDLSEILCGRLARLASSQYATAGLIYIRQTQPGYASLDSFEVGEDEVFAWWLPAFFHAWEMMCADFSSLNMELAEVEKCFGNGMHSLRSENSSASDHQLNQELSVLLRTCPGVDGAAIESATQLVSTAVRSHIDLTEMKDFILDLKKVLDMIGVSSVILRDDPDYATVIRQEQHLTNAWATTKLAAAGHLLEEISEALGGRVEVHVYQFVHLTERSLGIMSRMRSESIDDARTWGFIADNATFARLTQRVNDNQEFTDIETAAVNSLGTVHDLVALAAFNKHDSVQAFLGSIRDRGEITPKEFKTMTNIERTIQGVARVFQDASTTTDARDNKMLEDVLETGTWICREPRGLRGDVLRLSQQAITLRTKNKSFVLSQAEDLRDRLFLERQDSVSEDGSSFEQFHRTLEAVKAYSQVFVQLYLEGHRDFRDSDIFEELPLAGPNAVTAAAINAKRIQFENVLLKWRDDVNELRERLPFLNYLTVHQLMLLASDILAGSSSGKVLGTLRFIRNIKEQDISTWSDLLKEVFTKATAAVGASTSTIGLTLLERMGELFDLSFEGIPETFRDVHEDLWIDTSHLHGITLGEPNVCVSASPVEMLVSLYAPLRRMPQASEVLFCTSLTSIEEIRLWIRRAFDQARSLDATPRLYSLVYADALPLGMQLETTTSFQQMLSSKAYAKARKKFQVVFLCSQHNSLVVDVFRKYERPALEKLPLEHQRDILGSVFPNKWPANRWHNEASFVRAYASAKVGLGKSFAIAKDIKSAIHGSAKGGTHLMVPVPLSMHSGDLVNALNRTDQRKHLFAYHLNLFGGSEELDILLFQLLVLNNITDDLGRHFCIDGRHAMYIELPSDSNAAGDNVPAIDKLRFSSCLPQTRIELTRESLDKNVPYVQLPLKYLEALETNKLKAGQNGPKTFVGRSSPLPEWDGCVRNLMKHLPTVTMRGRELSVLDESMVLTTNFLKFLNCHLEKIDEFVNDTWGGPLGDQACAGMGKPDFRHSLVASFVDTASDYSGRCISPFSLLPNQLAALGIVASNDARDKEFALLRKWSVRPMILPCISPTGTGIVGYKLLALDPSQVPQATKDYWSKGFKFNTNWSFKDYSDISQEEGQELLQTVLGVTKMGDVPERFVITIDNIMKMLAIYFRVASGIPVVIMGETGCGKTFSITYLSKFLNIRYAKMDVHGGVKEADITAFMQEPLEWCRSGTNEKVWVFFDEINTCTCLHLFKEMLCDKSMHGEKLPANLELLAACNPYRMKPEEMEGAQGLEREVDTNVGAANANLVYAVEPIPESLLDLVWDYGTLNVQEEKRYIKAMLAAMLDEIREGSTAAGSKGSAAFIELSNAKLAVFSELFGSVMSHSHEFLRAVNGGEVSVVSLRDVARVIKLFRWFLDVQARIRDYESKTGLAAITAASVEDCAVEAMSLAAAHCYYFRLEEKWRRKYQLEIEEIVNDLRFAPLGAGGDGDVVEDEDEATAQATRRFDRAIIEVLASTATTGQDQSKNGLVDAVVDRLLGEDEPDEVEPPTRKSSIPRAPPKARTPAEQLNLLEEKMEQTTPGARGLLRDVYTSFGGMTDEQKVERVGQTGIDFGMLTVDDVRGICAPEDLMPTEEPEVQPEALPVATNVNVDIYRAGATGRVEALINLKRLKHRQEIADSGEVIEVIEIAGRSSSANDNRFAQLLQRQLKW